MFSRLAILVPRDASLSGDIAWEGIGHVVEELPDLYQLVKESRVDVLLVDDDRLDFTQSAALRVRRAQPQMDIWQFAESDRHPDNLPAFVDGYLSLDQGEQGISEKIERILQDKSLLQRYGLVGRSGTMKSVARTVERIAPTSVSVLIVGPSGSGKELVARAIHSDSSRSDRPFVAINCGALASGVLESELFGHEKGAFTGSVGKREGLFHKADGGTIFLDEIGETVPEMQVKLLRVLEDGTYYPVGSSTPQRVDVRVVAATNRDLTEAIAERQFRDDLYFRLGVVKIVLPSLQERSQDIQPLLHHFWKDGHQPSYTDSALNLLVRYDWPGNVRQLRNFATRMQALKPDSMVESTDVEKFIAEQHATATHLPVMTGKTVEEAGHELIYRAILQLGTEVRMLRDLITSHLPNDEQPSVMADERGESFEASSMEEMERLLIEKTLAATDGNRKETARLLGIGERTLYRKLSKYNLS